jgi:hypothetical protein
MSLGKSGTYMMFPDASSSRYIEDYQMERLRNSKMNNSRSKSTPRGMQKSGSVD